MIAVNVLFVGVVGMLFVGVVIIKYLQEQCTNLQFNLRLNSKKLVVIKPQHLSSVLSHLL